MLDLPQPLGPTTATMPVPGKTMLVRSANDLKPKISTLRRWNKRASLSPNSDAIRERGGLFPENVWQAKMAPATRCRRYVAEQRKS